MITLGGWPEPGYRVDIEGEKTPEDKAADRRMLTFLGITAAGLVGANALMNAAEKRAKRTSFRPAARAGKVTPLPLP